MEFPPTRASGKGILLYKSSLLSIKIPVISREGGTPLSGPCYMRAEHTYTNSSPDNRSSIPLVSVG